MRLWDWNRRIRVNEHFRNGASDVGLVTCASWCDFVAEFLFSLEEITRRRAFNVLATRDTRFNPLQLELFTFDNSFIYRSCKLNCSRIVIYDTPVR